MCVSTHPVYNCQCYVHVESAVGEVDSLWTIDEDGVVERFHPVSVTTLETELQSIIITNNPTNFEKPFSFFSDRVRLKNMVNFLVIVFSKFVHFRVQDESLKGSYCSGLCCSGIRVFCISSHDRSWCDLPARKHTSKVLYVLVIKLL